MLVRALSALSRTSLRDIISGAFGMFVLKVLGAGLLLLVHIFYARVLGVQGYGIFVYAFTVASMLALIGRFGFDQASVKFVSSYIAERKLQKLKGYLRYSRTFVTLTGAGLAFLMVIAAVIGKHLGIIQNDLVAAFIASAALVPAFSLLQLRDGVLRGLHRVVFAQLPQALLIPVILLAGLSICMIISPEITNPVLALLIYLIAVVVSLLVIESIASLNLKLHKLREIESIHDARWLPTAAALLMVSGFNFIILQTDTLMIGALIDTGNAGKYFAATRIAGLLVFVLVAINSVLSPQISQTYVLGNHKDMQLLLSSATRWSVLGGAGFGIALFFWGKPLLGLFGEEYRSAYSLLLILLVGQFFCAICGPVGTLLSMTGMHSLTARILGISAVMNVVLNYVFIKWFGVTGAACATAFTMSFWNIAMSIAAWKTRGVISFAGIASKAQSLS